MGEQNTLHEGQFLRLIREGHWEYVDRVRASGAAIIIAVTPEEKLLVVEQYRIPLHARTLEMPAGIIGDEPGMGDESQAEAARRELLEETGYLAERMEPVAYGGASSGVTSEVVTLFMAAGLKRTQAGGGVGHEDIHVHEVPLDSVDDWLGQKAAEGVLIDPKLYAGLYILMRRRASTP